MNSNLVPCGAAPEPHEQRPDPVAASGEGPRDSTPRRRFLITAGVAGAAIMVPGSVSAATELSRRASGGSAASAQRPAWLAGPSTAPSNADWNALRHHLSTGRLIQRGQAGYTNAKILFDPRFNSLSPDAIAYCGRPGDVAACLSFVTKFNLQFRIRSGGHSYEGWSSVTNGLIIDVSDMSSLHFGNGTVTVGSGIDLINFYAGLAARGVAVPGGSCPTVGIAGLALGGGVGVLGRAFGLTSDNIESLQIVTADGRTLTADSKQHSDLYWASRGGGGGNFGVATSFTFRTRDLRTVVLFFLGWPWSAASRVVNAWQSWAPTAPDALWSNMHLSAPTGGRPEINVGGAYVGSVAGAAQQLDRLYSLVGQGPSSHFLAEEPYLNAMLIEAGCSSLSVRECNTTPSGRLPHVPAFAKSDFFTRKLDRTGINVLLSGIERLSRVHGAAGGSGSIAFDAFGGVINRVRPTDTAFVHRDSLFLAQYSIGWNWPGSRQGVANQLSWLLGYYKALHPHASGQAYQNYIDAGLSDWRTAYYGQNYAALSQVKAVYDPHQLFRFPQAITPPAITCAAEPAC
jgi:FAD/FMN-containing dehydrogenase